MARSLMSALLGGLPGGGRPTPAATNAPALGGPTTQKMVAISHRIKAEGRIIAINAKDPENITVRRLGEPVASVSPEPKKMDLVSRKIEAAIRTTVEHLEAGLDHGIALIIQAPQGSGNDMVDAATFAGVDPLMANLMFAQTEGPQSQTIFTYCASAAEEAEARASGTRMVGKAETKGAVFAAIWRDEDTGDICIMPSPVDAMKGPKREIEEALPNRTQVSYSSRAQASLLQVHEMSGASRRYENTASGRKEASPTHASALVREALPALATNGNLVLKSDPEQPDLEGLDNLRHALNRSKFNKLSYTTDEGLRRTPAAAM